MGTKSSNIISKKEMLPLFQVISDLEKPLPSSTSLQTNFSSNIDNSSNLSCKSRFTSKLNDNSSIPSCCLNSELSYISHYDHEFVSDSGDKKRNKKRRRLKSDNNINNNMHYRQCRRKKDDSSSENNKIKLNRSKSNEIVLKPEIHQDMEMESKKFFPEIEKRKLGMFSTMTLERYDNDDIDLSRHFKNVNLNEKDNCPIYEIPKDVIKSEVKNIKKKRRKQKVKDLDDNNMNKIIMEPLEKRNFSKRAIIKRYEHMLEMLIQKCQDNEQAVLDKDKYLIKMKKKLKEVLVYNNQFAEENKYMKRQHEDMKNCIDRYKSYTQSLEEQQQQNQEQRRHSDTIVQTVCPRCSIVELSAIKIEKENTKLNEDVVMLKNVVFRLNVQLSRYQDKLRFVTENVDQMKQSNNSEKIERNVSIPSLPHFSNVNDETKDNLKTQSGEDTYTVGYEGCNAWGDVNSHTLAPLLNAYQESLMEKDDLIHDYEKEFNRFTVKIKQIIEENNDLHSNTIKLASDLMTLRETSHSAVKERDDLKRENYELKEKLDDIERKLKSVQESFEQKIETMSRDYTLIHQEYFKTKTGLAAAQGRCQALEDQQKNLQSESLIPANVHIQKIEECKRSFEELRNRYEIDKSKMAMRLSILEENNNVLESKHVSLNNEKYNLESKIKSNDRIIKKMRNTLAAYQKDLSALKTSRDVYRRKAERAVNLSRQLAETLEQAAGDDRFQHLKAETMSVQKEALKELDALETRLKEQDMTLHKMQEDKAVETSKLENIIREKEATIEAMKRYIDGERLTRFAGRTVPTFSADLRSTSFKIKKGDQSGHELNHSMNKSSHLSGQRKN